MGRVRNLLIGLSYGWWIYKHNRHHAHPNQVGQRPRHRRRGIAFTSAQALPRGAGRWVARHQAGCSSRCCSSRACICMWRGFGRC